MAARSKFRNIPTVVDGHRFPSRKEARTYQTLRFLESQGKVRDLRLQVSYRLVVGGKLVCKYVADFVYYDVEKHREVVADAKGFRTREFKLKKKLMLACLGIEIMEL